MEPVFNIPAACLLIIPPVAILEGIDALYSVFHSFYKLLQTINLLGQITYCPARLFHGSCRFVILFYVFNAAVNFLTGSRLFFAGCGYCPHLIRAVSTIPTISCRDVPDWPRKLCCYFYVGNRLFNVFQVHARTGLNPADGITYFLVATMVFFGQLVPHQPVFPNVHLLHGSLQLLFLPYENRHTKIYYPGSTLVRRSPTVHHSTSTYLRVLLPHGL